MITLFLVSAFAGDICTKLNTNDGTSAFNVQDSVGATIFSVASSGEVGVKLGDGTSVSKLLLDGKDIKLKIMAHDEDKKIWIQSGQSWGTNTEAADIYFTGINGSPVQMIIKGNGNVGIGTAAPVSHVPSLLVETL